MRLKVFIHKTPVIFSAVLIGIFMATPAFATIYYVSTSGNNQTGDGTTTRPWATLSFACSRVNAFGDTIQVKAGAYTDNTQCILARGIKVIGDGTATTTINSTASPYILAKTSVPVVDGSNEISAIKFNGGDSAATAILSAGRNNQKVHDNIFANFTGKGVRVFGKFGRDDTGGSFWFDACVGSESSGTWCYNDPSLSTSPITTDWGTGIQIYNNVFNDAQLDINLLNGANIYNNTFNNNGAYGSKRSAIGNTGYWFRSIKVHDNTINIADMGWAPIGVELWENADECEFYNNTSDSWFSIRGSSVGLSSGFSYNYKIHDNRFVANYTPTTPAPALEIMSDVQGALIYNNYFEGSAWGYGVAVWSALSGGNKKTDDVLHNITIYGNIFYRLTNTNSYGAIQINANNANTDINSIRIYHNVFDNNKQGVNLSWATNSVLNGVEIKNNIFVNHTDKAIVANGSGMGTYQVTSNYQWSNKLFILDNASKSIQSGNIQAQPALMYSGNKPDPYYRPSSGTSNVVNAGVVVGLPYTGAAPDIGAYEYQSLAPPQDLRIIEIFP